MAAHLRKRIAVCLAALAFVCVVSSCETSSLTGTTAGTTFFGTGTTTFGTFGPRIVIVGGNGQTIGPLQELRVPFTVQVFDQFGLVVPGIEVFWEITFGGGALFTFVSVTDFNGLAFNLYRAGPFVTTANVIATVRGLPPVIFTVFITPARTGPACTFCP
jgi:hypothetical protein